MKLNGRTNMYRILRVIPFFWRFAPAFSKKGNQKFVSSSQYWENRYAIGGTSGAGSFGKLAKFKAGIINKFVRAHGVRSLIEFGCGDGNQLALACYENYIGLDISKSCIRLCREKFGEDETKNFLEYSPKYFPDSAELSLHADLALSLDVIYHLVEDDIFQSYMRVLFQSADKYVIIYSSNFDREISGTHVKHRKFTDHVREHFLNLDSFKHIRNKYPAKSDNDECGSFSEFFIYQRKNVR